MDSSHLILSAFSNGGQMIKFQLFDSENSYQCHFSEIATFVVSIAHYMRAYFNYQALQHGKEFELPGDAGYLNVRRALFSDHSLPAPLSCPHAPLPVVSTWNQSDCQVCHASRDSPQ
jgi:hypothetical protein